MQLNEINQSFRQLSEICHPKKKILKPKRSKKGFKAGSLGGHVGVKFKLASASLSKIKKKQEWEQEKKAAEQHKARMAPKL